MREIVRYVTVFEKVGDQPGEPILASSDPDAVSEVVRVIAERAQRAERPLQTGPRKSRDVAFT